MNKKTQLIFFVILFFVIIIFLWFLLGFNKNRFNFGFGNDFDGVKNIITKNLGQLNVKDEIAEKMESLKTEAINELQKKEDAKKMAIEKIVDKLNSATSSIQFISYEHEAWKIQFDYDSQMKKEYDSQKQEIFLYYENNKDINIRINKQKLTNQTFNSWLNKNFDLQKLNKEENNNLIFWYQDLDDEKLYIREYYLNIEKDIYTLRAQNPKTENYQDVLNFIVKSFKKY